MTDLGNQSKKKKNDFTIRKIEGGVGGVVAKAPQPARYLN